MAYSCIKTSNIALLLTTQSALLSNLVEIVSANFKLMKRHSKQGRPSPKPIMHIAHFPYLQKIYKFAPSLFPHNLYRPTCSEL